MASLGGAILAVLLLIAPIFAGDLSTQTIALTLERQFAGPDISYIVVDDTGAIIAQRWSDESVPVGSLMKPFTALAYRRTHSAYPELVCRGSAGGCWRPAGPGRIGIVTAIAQSCNGYFRQLGAGVSAMQLSAVLKSFDLPEFTSQNAAARYGAGDAWRAPPAILLRAYLELASRRQSEEVKPILEGMVNSANNGTAALLQPISGRALAKTGTAPCVHQSHAPGDGYAVVLYPADAPRIGLLVRLHGQPGSHAAGVAGVMLRAVIAPAATNFAAGSR